ncbi:ferredoxin-6 [Abditibacteriota bacterium]|nr:ferredoxin-6 [Abditibacteriota bacterium]
MSQVTFISPQGEKIVVKNAMGNLMEIATEHDVEGIEGNCGGVCSCGTCHVWVEPEWLERVGQASEIERGILNFEDNSNERSRLCCQIEMTDDLDGIVVKVAN